MLRAAVIGATGVVGQQFTLALSGHPWFEVVELTSSEKHVGKAYGEALRDPATGALRWYCDQPLPKEVADLQMKESTELDASRIDIAFSAVESGVARELEPRFAKHVPVVSTASAFRYEKDVPILIPGVNNEHADLLHEQAKRGWKGFIAPIPNCTTTGLVISLKPIDQRFGVKSVLVTSMQAVSGAGRASGVLAMDIVDNLIPYIPEEERKVKTETRKILGALRNGRIVEANIDVSATCTRVNVSDGHTESVSVSTRKRSSPEKVREALRGFAKSLRSLKLPSAPDEFIVVHDDPYRPQPKIDRNTYGGMATVVGRIREDEVLENGVKYVLLSHNTKMGAANGAVLLAELLYRLDYIRHK